ncbi:MAG: glycoside hydrolase family 3 C-terminal domain-containing protein, partial [Lachnospiraceae bacterium]|nr:glycoside hydrolase family 3 C-terminal domain-containing protein [Lachnospiraceae bacterium]
AGSALDLSWADENVNAIVQCFYPGARGGKAIAELLYGEFSPSAKLPITFYRSDDDLPDFKDYSMEGRTYRYFKGSPLYPFGYGKSYSKITYSDASIDRTEGTAEDTFTVGFTVKNEGTYLQHEAVQLYVKDVEASTRVANWTLRKIANVELEPGEERRISFVLTKRDFAIIDEKGRCIVEPGSFKIALGGQQPDERSRELTGESCHFFDININGETVEAEY